MSASFRILPWDYRVEKYRFSLTFSDLAADAVA